MNAPRRRRVGLLATLGLALAAPVAAHWQSPEEIVFDLNAPGVHDAFGVVSVARDEKAPRLLVIRVGERWYRLALGLRKLQATDWAELWRHNVPQGIVAILDDTTARPVVGFDAAGAVAEIRERPAAP